MQIQARNSQDISVGANAIKAFAIKPDAEMMFGLISGIAQDKIGYCMREVSSNAQDYSPPDKPFELHLPTIFNPTIRWRDFGASMSHDFVMERATTIGDSGSREFMNKLGGFGLGSKSPFGYLISSSTDGGGAYTTRCFQGGKVRTYLMVISKNGMPECRYYGEVETNEPDGTEIMFPVRKEDINLWAKSAKEILWTFNPAPKIFPAFTDEVFDDTIVEQGKNWKLLKRNTPLGTTPHVRMGSVTYPINMAAAERGGWDWRNQPVLFEAPIGSLKPIRSREALEYTVETKRVLHALMKEFEDDFASTLNNRFAGNTSYIQACANLQELYQTTSGLALLENRAVLKFGDRPLTSKFRGDKTLFTCMTASTPDDYTSYWGMGLPPKYDQTTDWIIPADAFKNVKTVVIHTSHRAVERMRNLSVDLFPVIVVKGYVDGVEKLVKEKFGLPVVHLKDVKVPKITRTQSVGGPRLRQIADLSETKHAVDLDKGGLFVIEARQPKCRLWTVLTTTANTRRPLGNVSTALRQLKDLGFLPKDQQVFVFRPDDVPPLNKGWRYFGEYLSKEILPKLDDDVIVKADNRTPLDENSTRGVGLLDHFKKEELPDDIHDYLSWAKSNRRDKTRKTVAEEVEKQRLLRSALGYVLGDIPLTSTASGPSLDAENRAKRGDLFAKHPTLAALIGMMPYWDDSLRDGQKDQFAEYFGLLLNQK